MKKMRIVAVLAAMLCLGGCTQDNPNDVFEVSSVTSVAESAAESTINDTVLQDYGYAYANMQKNVPSGDFARYGDEVLFFGKNNGSTVLYTYDLASGEVSTFCKDATCQHTGSACAAGGAVTNLESYGGTVYALTAGGSVLELQNEKFEPIIDSGVKHFFHSDGKLYVQTMDASLLVYEKDFDKPTVVIDEYDGYWETVWDDTLYYSFSGIHAVDLTAEQPTAVDLVQDADCVTDGEYIYYADYTDNLLRRCKPDGGEVEQLTDYGVLAASWNFDDEYFYFRRYEGALEGDGDIYRMSKADPTQIELLATLPETAYQIYTVPGDDVLFVKTYQTGNVYAVQKDGSDVKLLEL